MFAKRGWTEFVRDPQTQALVDAARQAARSRLYSEASRDIQRLGLAGLGIGAAARGATGLAGLLRKNLNTRAQPAVVTLPYPVEEEEGNDKAVRKKAADSPAAGVFRKLAASTFDITGKTAIPWYRPAMMLAGMGGLYGGWKGVDVVLDAQRKATREKELEEARQEFHDALFAQYDKPLRTGSRAKQSDDARTSLCARLGGVFDAMEKVAQAVKSGSRLGDLTGEAAGWYGTYAALSGLATGALVYEQARKRQRRRILDAAIKRRERHRYYTAPPEIVAMPEPVRKINKPSLNDEKRQLIEGPSTELVETKLAGDSPSLREGQDVNTTRTTAHSTEPCAP